MYIPEMPPPITTASHSGGPPGCGSSAALMLMAVPSQRVRGAEQGVAAERVLRASRHQRKLRAGNLVGRFAAKLTDGFGDQPHAMNEALRQVAARRVDRESAIGSDKI